MRVASAVCLAVLVFALAGCGGAAASESLAPGQTAGDETM
jgi:hypothetical protein